MTDSKPPSDSEEHKASQGRTVVKAVVHVLVLIGGLALYILLGIVLWWALNQYIDPQNSRQKGDVVQALALLMAGVAAAVGIYFTWRGQGITREGQQISRDNIEITRESAEEQGRRTQEGQSTERYTRAIDQLGVDKLEVRLGAIYELEQVSRVSEVLRTPILEVLTAYVRANASLSDRLRWSEETEEVYPPHIDVQAILTVLGRRVHHSEGVELEPLDLHGTYLGHSSLQGANLRGADLQGANLKEADLQGANLKEADLRRANLQGADLYQADLQGADLRGANLQGADLREVHGLPQELIKFAIGSNETMLSGPFIRPALWSRSTEEQARLVSEYIDLDRGS